MLHHWVRFPVSSDEYEVPPLGNYELRAEFSWISWFISWVNCEICWFTGSEFPFILSSIRSRETLVMGSSAFTGLSASGASAEFTAFRDNLRFNFWLSVLPFLRVLCSWEKLNTSFEKFEFRNLLKAVKLGQWLLILQHKEAKRM